MPIRPPAQECGSVSTGQSHLGLVDGRRTPSFRVSHQRTESERDASRNELADGEFAAEGVGRPDSDESEWG